MSETHSEYEYARSGQDCCAAREESRHPHPPRATGPLHGFFGRSAAYAAQVPPRLGALAGKLLPVPWSTRQGATNSEPSERDPFQI